MAQTNEAARLRDPSGPAAGARPVRRTPARDLTGRQAALLVVAATVLNAALALHDLSRSLWIDEGASWLIASQHGRMFLHSVAHEGGDMLLYYLILHVTVMVWGGGPTVLRLPSVIAGAASIPIVYALGRQALGTRLAGVCSAVCMACSLSLVFWEQNARAYSLDMALAAATTLMWLLAVRDRRRGAMVAWVVLSVAAIYAHPLALLLVIAQVPVVLLARPDRALLGRVGAALAAIAVLCIPFALIATHRGTGQIDWLARPHLRQVKGTIDVITGVTGGLVAPNRQWLADAIVVAWAFAALVLAYRYARRRPTAPLVGTALMLSCLVVPPVVAYVATFEVQPVFLGRYLLISLPAGVVLLVAACRSLGPRPLAALAMAAFVVVRLAVAAPAYRAPVEPDEQIAGYVVAHAEPGDCVAFYVSSERVVYDYYLRRWHEPGPTQVLPASSASIPLARLKTLDDETYQQTLPDYSRARIDHLTGCRRVWLVYGHFGSPDVAPTQAEYHEYPRLERALARRWPHADAVLTGLRLYGRSGGATVGS